MLEVNELNAYYGKSHILRGVNLKIDKGEIVSLLGRNGVGRSTTCKAIMGEVEPLGSIKFNGKELSGKKLSRSLSWVWVTCLKIEIYFQVYLHART